MKGSENMNISNEQLAHDLALSVVTAKLNKQAYPSADIAVIKEYKNAYTRLLSLIKRYGC